MKNQEIRWVQRANSFGRASTYFAETVKKTEFLSETP